MKFHPKLAYLSLIFTLQVTHSRAETYLTSAKIISSLKAGESLMYLLPCSLSDGKHESACAVIHTPDVNSEFRVYTHGDDPGHAAKVAYSFLPGELGAEGFLGSASHDSNTKILETNWSHVGVYGGEVQISVEYVKGQYSHHAVETKRSKPNRGEFFGHWKASQLESLGKNKFKFNSFRFETSSQLAAFLKCAQQKKSKLHAFLSGSSGASDLNDVTDAYLCQGEISASSCGVKDQLRECR